MQINFISKSQYKSLYSIYKESYRMVVLFKKSVRTQNSKQYKSF